MNPSTVSRLRTAAIDALSSGDDESAQELIAMIAAHPVAPQHPAEFTPSMTVMGGPPHDFHFWASLLREKFFPFLTCNGRCRFTSNELLSWIENAKGIPFTTGDVAMLPSGKIAWKSRITAALGSLKQEGHLLGTEGGKRYEIAPSSLPGHESLSLLASASPFL